jgi:hypothetical protein
MKYLAVLAVASGLILSAQSPFYSEQEYQFAHSIFDNLSTDLKTAEAHTPPSAIAQARANVDVLVQNWDRGIYGPRQMDETISALETATDQSLSLTDRANLSDDVSRLLDLRRMYY